MSTTIASAVIVVSAAVILFLALYMRYRGKRIITCPETNLPATAEVDAALAAGTTMATRPRFVVTACSRWPERAGCDQACAPQIEASPEETRVRSVVARWYRARRCFYCSRRIRDVGGAVAPGFLGTDGALREWKDIPANDLPDALANAVAVCANCELAEDFRRRFPDLVTERADTPLRHRAVY